MRAKWVLHHDDPPCTARLEGRYCPECRVVANMQSTELYCYCPDCDFELKKMKCPVCKHKFEKPTGH